METVDQTDNMNLYLQIPCIIFDTCSFSYILDVIKLQVSVIEIIDLNYRLNSSGVESTIVAR